MVWGSNWPHPNENNKPDDALLFDQLAQWAREEAVRNNILVDNPATLYGLAGVDGPAKSSGNVSRWPAIHTRPRRLDQPAQASCRRGTRRRSKVVL
jgi:hypothetical protein